MTGAFPKYNSLLNNKNHLIDVFQLAELERRVVEAESRAEDAEDKVTLAYFLLMLPFSLFAVATTLMFYDMTCSEVTTPFIKQIAR